MRSARAALPSTSTEIGYPLIPTLPTAAATALDTIASSVPPNLLGNGTNLASHRPQITASNDIEAIRQWLAEYGPNSRRAYRKEIERFLRWCMLRANKPFSSVTRTDIRAYEGFLAAPDAAWCSPRHHKKGTEGHRPFEGPLAGRSIAYALTVLGVCFQWLCDVGYLEANPMKARRATTAAIGKKQSTVERPHIPLPILADMVRLLTQQADSFADDALQARAPFERMLFLVRLLANTGLRRGEAASACNGDVFSRTDPTTGQTGWYLRVVGKGNKERYVVFNDSARAALARYQAFNNGLSGSMKTNSQAPLVHKLGGYRLHDLCLSASSIYGVVAQALSFAATRLRTDSPDAAGLLDQATPHWFRHTFATIALGMGHPIMLVKDQLGHESIATTATYQHPDLFHMYATFNAMHI